MNLKGPSSYSSSIKCLLRFQTVDENLVQPCFRVWGYEFGFWVSGFGFRVSNFGFRVSDFGFRVSGFGVRPVGEEGGEEPVERVDDLRIQGSGLSVSS